MSDEIKNIDQELDATTLDQIKAGLLKEREQLTKDANEVAGPDSEHVDNVGAKFPEYGDKPDENAQEISEYTANLATEKVVEDALGDIDSALKRIENKTYGTCKYCGKPIGVKRLLARPTASSCITCKTELQNE